MEACKGSLRLLGTCALIVVLMMMQIGHGMGCSRVVGRQVYARCQDLGAQGATIAYTYNRGTRRLDVAFMGVGVRGASGWVGWGINPTAWGMMGSSVLVAFQAHNGTTVLPFKLSPAAQAGQRLVSGPIDLTVVSRAAFIRGSSFTIWATLQLHPSQSTRLNMIWNRGSAVLNLSPLPHSLLPQDLRGFTSIDVAL